MRFIEGPQTADTVGLPSLKRSYSDFRGVLSTLLSVGTGIATVVACIPLFSVLIMLFWRGGARLGWELFVELPPTAFEDGGGFGNAIVGSLVMVGIAALISVPFGILAAVFLAEFGSEANCSLAKGYKQQTVW